MEKTSQALSFPRHFQPIPLMEKDSIPPKIMPLQIKFKEMEQEANDGRFIDRKIHTYALNALEEIQKIHVQMEGLIRSYNKGNEGNRDAINSKVEKILGNWIRSTNFPKTLAGGEEKTLSGFLTPIKLECKRMQNELFRKEREKEYARDQYEKEKSKQLSQLLRNEQEDLLKCSSILNPFLEKLSQEVAEKNTRPSVYIAYAWPTPEREEDERWVQDFLKNLHDHLKKAGINAAKLDIVSNTYGANIYDFMKGAKKSDYALIFGTESLKDKHDTGLSAVCTEFIQILQKRQQDVKKGLRRVFPILISGQHQDALPTEYERYITVRDWRQRDYLTNFQSMYLELFGRAPASDYLDQTEGFLKELKDIQQDKGKQLEEMQKWYAKQRGALKKASTIEELLAPIKNPIRLTPKEQGTGGSSKNILIKRLKESYRSKNKITIFTTRKKEEWKLCFPIQNLYTQLTIITEEESQEKSRQRQTNVIDDRLTTYETIYAAKEKIDPKNIFKQEKMKDTLQKRAIIFGSAGVGKTTFVDHILYDWANGNCWTEFETIFCLKLRTLNKAFYPNERGHSYTASELLQMQYSHLGLNFQKELESQTFRGRSLLILEGYDELPSAAKEGYYLAQAFRELKEMFPHILITSRPGRVEENYSIEFEILGFEDSQIESYIRQFFKHLGEIDQTPSNEIDQKSQAFTEYIRSYPLIHSLVRIPINLTILSSLFYEEPQFFSSQTSLSMGELYGKVVDLFHRVFLVRLKAMEDLHSVENPELNPQINSITKVLEKFAMEAMNQNSLFVSISDIEKVIQREGVELNRIRDLGLFRVEKIGGSFIHLTFQEFFAAKYISRLLRESSEKAAKIIRKKKFDPRWQIVLSMTAGVLAQDETTLQHFFDQLYAPPRDLGGLRELMLLAKHFKECGCSAKKISQYRHFVNSMSHVVKDSKITDSARSFAAKTLGEVTREGGAIAKSEIQKLIVFLKSSNAGSQDKRIVAEVMEEVAKGGGKLAKEGLEGLIVFLKDPGVDPWDKGAAAKALGEVVKREGALAKEGIKGLVKLIKDSNLESCDKNFLALVLLEGEIAFTKEGIEGLVALVEDLQLQTHIKMSVVSAILQVVKRGGALAEKGIEGLVICLTGPDNGSKEFVANGLEEVIREGGILSREQLKNLIVCLKDPRGSWDKKFVVKVLKEVAKKGGGFGKEVLRELSIVLKDPNLNSWAVTSIVEALTEVAEEGGELPEEGIKELIAVIKGHRPVLGANVKSDATKALIMLLRNGRAIPKKDLKDLFLTAQLDQGTHQKVGQLLDQYLQSFNITSAGMKFFSKACRLHERAFYKIGGSYFVANARTVYPIKYVSIAKRKRKRASSLDFHQIARIKRRKFDFYRRIVLKMPY